MLKQLQFFSVASDGRVTLWTLAKSELLHQVQRQGVTMTASPALLMMIRLVSCIHGVFGVALSQDCCHTLNAVSTQQCQFGGVHKVLSTAR